MRLSRSVELYGADCEVRYSHRLENPYFLLISQDWEGVVEVEIELTDQSSCVPKRFWLCMRVAELRPNRVSALCQR